MTEGRNKKGQFMKGFPHNKTHGFRRKRQRFYTIWYQMKKRCREKKNTVYAYYGGRGISYAPKWEKFDDFRRDMHESYEKHVLEFGENQTQLDRMDNSMNYSKDNCRWATRKEQGRNKRNNVFLTFRGETKTISHWADEYGLSYVCFWKRIRQYGWTMEDALMTPMGQSIDNT